MRSAVQNAISIAQSEYGGSLVITGHSLGAAEALVAASDTYGAGKGRPAVTTFGCPRVFNQQGAAWFHGSVAASSVRMVHEKDIVPHLPPDNLGYYHVPQEVWQTGGVYQTCSSSDGEDPACSAQFPADECNVADHLDYMGVQGLCK